jgi:hypothetical protein
LIPKTQTYRHDGAAELVELARAGRRLQGVAQTVNLGADIFLPMKMGAMSVASAIIATAFRVACIAQNCGRREHLNDDLQVVSLSKELIAAPPVTLWPNVVRRVIVPPDMEALLLTDLERAE